MDLHDHSGIAPGMGNPTIDCQHRQLDQIGGRSLHRRIDRCTLGVLTPRLVARIDVLRVQAPAKHSLDEALFARLCPRAVHERLHAGVAREV